MQRIAILALVLLLVGGTVAYGSVNGTYQGYPVVKVVVNGTELQPDVPAIIMDGRTLLPVRAVAEALGATVEWQQESYTVTVGTLLSDAEMLQQVVQIVQPVQNLMRDQVAVGAKRKEHAQKLQHQALDGILRLRGLAGETDGSNTVHDAALCFLWSVAGFGICVANAFDALAAHDLDKADKQKALANQFAEGAKAFALLYENTKTALEGKNTK